MFILKIVVFEKSPPQILAQDKATWLSQAEADVKVEEERVNALKDKRGKALEELGTKAG